MTESSATSTVINNGTTHPDNTDASTVTSTGTAIDVGRLRVDRALYDFVCTELLPQAGLPPDAFWSGFEALVDDLAPINRELLAVRDRLQEQLDLTMTRAEVPLSRLMLAQTSQASITQIATLAGAPAVSDPVQHPFTVKLAAFVLSELKTAFMIGCMLFIPFLVIDLVVASVLMAMGMMMQSPMVISLPLKLLLFVLVDGWTLTVNTLVSSIR